MTSALETTARPKGTAVDVVNGGSGDSASRHHVTDIAGLSGSQKAAIVVQMILSEGGKMDLGTLAPASQLRLALDYASMVRVNRATLDAVVAEFEAELETGGLEFPSDPEDIISRMDGLISSESSGALRDRLGLGVDTDPWRAVQDLPPEALAQALAAESPSVGALILSKLKPELANEALEQMDPEHAKATVLAIAQTGGVPPGPVATIGSRLAAGTTRTVALAFPKDPIARSAAILNAAGAAEREAMLEAFEAQDAGFARALRKAIFTFADIPARVAPVDIPKFVRDVPGDAMVTALAAAQTSLPAVVDFILDNMSKRMAEGLREEMVELGEVATKPGEAAMSQVTSVIRALADEGVITLIVPSEDEAAP